MPNTRCRNKLQILQWRHKARHGVSNHLRLHWLLICWFRRKSNKTSKLRVTGRWPVNSPHKRPVTWEMFPFGGVIVEQCQSGKNIISPLLRTNCCYGWENNRMSLTHWGRVTHICVSKLTIIGSDNGLSPGRRQAIIWNNTGLLLIEPFGTNFSEISIGIQRFSFKKMHLNMSSAKWRPFCLGLNVLKKLSP